MERLVRPLWGQRDMHMPEWNHLRAGEREGVGEGRWGRSFTTCCSSWCCVRFLLCDLMTWRVPLTILELGFAFLLFFSLCSVSVCVCGHLPCASFSSSSLALGALSPIANPLQLRDSIAAFVFAHIAWASYYQNEANWLLFASSRSPLRPYSPTLPCLHNNCCFHSIFMTQSECERVCVATP